MCFRTDNRFASFTPGCLDALEIAAEKAARLGESHVDTLDAIFGLSKGDDSTTLILEDFKVSPQAIQTIYDDLYAHRECIPRKVETLTLSPDLSSSVTRAIQIAEDFESPFVDGVIFLFAITELKRTFGMRQLRRIGVRYYDLINRLCDEMAILLPTAA